MNYCAAILIFLVTLSSAACVKIERVERVETVSTLKQLESQTELVLESAGLKAIVAPTNYKNVMGIIHVKIDKIPIDAERITVMLYPQAMQPDSDPYTEKNVIYELVDAKTDEIFLDTEKVENGVYNIAVSAAKESPQPGSEKNWIDSVRTQVIVEN
jgi:hypothetical protein